MAGPSLADLPDDVLQHLAELLADEAAANALGALQQTSKAVRNISDGDAIHRLLARGLGITPGGSISCVRAMVRAVCHADATLCQHASCTFTVGSTRVQLLLAPTCRVGSVWLDRLKETLITFGLAACGASSSHGAVERPFYFITCDARPLESFEVEAANLGRGTEQARAATAGGITSSRSRLAVSGGGLSRECLELPRSREWRTAPCLRPRCLQPAASGCLHCAKHAGCDARAVLEAIVGEARRRDAGAHGDAGAAIMIAEGHRCAGYRWRSLPRSPRSPEIAEESRCAGTPMASPRRVLLVAPSEAVYEAFRRSCVAAGRASEAEVRRGVRC